MLHGFMQVSVAALSFVLGFVAVTGSYVMKLIPKTRALQRVLVHFFRAQPPFLLGEGLIELTRFNFERELAQARGGASSTASSAAVGESTGAGCRQHFQHMIQHVWKIIGPVAIKAKCDAFCASRGWDEPLKQQCL